MTDIEFVNKKPKKPAGRPIEMLSVTEAASRKGVNTASIRRAILDERLPAQKIGGRWLLRPADVERWTPRTAWAPGRKKAEPRPEEPVTFHGVPLVPGGPEFLTDEQWKETGMGQDDTSSSD